MQPSSTVAQHPPCHTPCWRQIAPHFGHLCKRQIGNAETNYRRPRTPRNLPPKAPPERGLAGKRALFRRLASVVITAIPPETAAGQTRGRPRGAFRQAGSVPDRGGRNIKVCPNGRARAATFLPIPPGNCRRDPRHRRTAGGTRPASPSASRTKPTNALTSSSGGGPSRRRVRAGGTQALPGSKHRRSSH